MYQLVLEPSLSWKSIKTKGEEPHAREGHSFNYAESKNIFVLFGGSAGEEEFNDVQTFDPASLSWNHGEWWRIPACRSEPRTKESGITRRSTDLFLLQFS